MVAKKVTLFQDSGIFAFLLLLSTLFPSNVFSWWTISLEPIAFITIFLLCLYKIFVTIGFAHAWERYHLQVILFSLYQLVCLISLYLNLHLYEDTADVIRYGIYFIILFTSVPLTLLLFSLPPFESEHFPRLVRFQQRSLELPTFLAVFVCLLTMWQTFDYQSAKTLTQFFVSSEIWPDENINSIFKINTDLGSLLAISLIFSLLLSNANGVGFSGKTSVTIVVMVGLIFISGMLTGSRSFLLGITVGTFSLLIVSKNKNEIVFNLFSYILFILAFGHFLILTSPYATTKMATIFPYFQLLFEGEVIAFSDFIPQITDTAFGGRLELWSSSISALSSNFWFGLSNGGARFTVSPDYHLNSHNFLIQVFLDSGLIGFILMAALVSSILIKLSNLGLLKKMLAIILTVLSTLTFDYFIDHSLPWIIVTAYLLCNCYRILKNSSGLQVKQKVSAKKSRSMFSWLSYVLGSAIFTWMFYNYNSKLTVNQNKSIEERVVSSASRLVRDYNDFIFVDDRFIFNKKQIRQGTGWRFNPIVVPTDKLDRLCEFVLPQSAFILAVEKAFVDTSNIEYHKYYVNKSSSSKDLPGFVTIRSSDFSCDSYDYKSLESLSRKGWSANRLDLRLNKNPQIWPLWGYIAVASKIYKIPKGSFVFSLKASGQFGVGEWPELKISILDRKGSDLAEPEVFTIKADNLVEYSFKISENTTGFIQLEFINDLWDESTKEDRAIFIAPESIKLERVDL